MNLIFFQKQKQLLQENYFKYVKYLNIFSILILVYYSEVFFEPIFHLVSNFFHGNLFNLHTLSPISDELLYIHSKLITLGFVLLVFFILFKNINLLIFSLIVFFVFQTKVYEFLDFHIHEFLFSTGIYDSFLRGNATQINPQYTRILLFSIAFLTLSIMIIFKKQRTIDRMFMVLIGTSMIITTFIFHISIPMGMYAASKHEKSHEYLKHMVELPIGYFCQDKNCYILDEKYSIKKKLSTNNTIPENIELNYINFISNYFSQKENINKIHFQSNGNFIGTDLIFMACSYKPKENVTLCAFDNKKMSLQGLSSKSWFSFLTSIAHFVWIFFGFGLLFLHKSKIIHKSIHRNNLQSSSNSSPEEK